MAYGNWGSGKGGGRGKRGARIGRRGARIGCQVAGAALIALASCGGGDPGGTLAAPRDGAAGSNQPGPDIDGGFASGSDGSVDAAVVTNVTFAPPNALGEVGLGLTVSGGRGALNVLVAYSRAGRPFKDAAVTVPAVQAAPGGTTNLTVVWRPLEDIGFRPDPGVVLRFTVVDELGSGPAAPFPAPAFSNRHGAAHRVDHYMANYGTWNDATVATAHEYDLVITHPGQAMLTRSQVAALQQGVDPEDPRDDVLVLCYVSVGEDLRTKNLTDEQMRADPRFRGDGTGPRIDPRGYGADGMSLEGIDPRGLPSTGGTGFASYYLDDNDVANSPNHRGDGFPDRNKIFRGAFVNAGDPAWFPVIDGMTIENSNRPGFRESMTPDFGRGLDCDGVFLDTIDTCAPNTYTDASSANQSEFEWTAPGFGSFIRRAHSAYPERVILQNRGLFFFDPRHPQYRFNARGAIDFFLFESFRLNSSRTADNINPVYYADNRYNVAPKLMAEANRPDGFEVLSLGYAAGTPDQMLQATLLGTSTVGLATLLEDIHVTQDLQGFRHYITDGGLGLVNDFVVTHSSMGDSDPPTWTSTYNDVFVTPAVAPTPRVGIQEAEGGGGKVTVRWDVALDKSGVGYALYMQSTPFDFAGDPTLSHSRRLVLSPSVPQAYLDGVGPGRFPNEATITNLPPGQQQYLLIRAFDNARPQRHEETNQVVLNATP